MMSVKQKNCAMCSLMIQIFKRILLLLIFTIQTIKHQGSLRLFKFNANVKYFSPIIGPLQSDYFSFHTVKVNIFNLILCQIVKC